MNVCKMEAERVPRLLAGSSPAQDPKERWHKSSALPELPIMTLKKTARTTVLTQAASPCLSPCPLEEKEKRKKERGTFCFVTIMREGALSLV